MIPVLDTSAWQSNTAFNSTMMTLAPGWRAPDFTVAARKGIAGNIARCSIGDRVDPYYAPCHHAAIAAGIIGAAYHWLEGLPLADEITAMARAIDGAPPRFFMLDIEDNDMTPAVWRDRKLLDYVFGFLELVAAHVASRIAYTADWWWDARVSRAVAAEYADDFARYDLMVAHYSHQPAPPAGVDANAWRLANYPVVPTDPSQWEQWLRTTQTAPSGRVDAGEAPDVPIGWDTWDGQQGGSWALASDYGFTSKARLDFNVVKPDAWARWTAPLTIPEVLPVEVPRFPYQYGSRTVTLAEQAELDTYQRLHPEVRRRFVGVQLACLVEAGIGIGIGTAWRVQPAGQANHADPGDSYHEGMTVASKANALAIDTVSPPIHAVGWSAMEKRLRQFGFTSFTIPQIPANFNVEARAYNGAWDRPHIQPYEVRYGRPSEAKLHGVSSPNLGPIPLGKWPIPPQYDLDLIDINNPLGGAVQPAPHPPAPIPSVPYIPTEEDDDVRFRGYYQLAGTIGIWAVYDGLKCKTWVMNLEMMAALNGQLKEQGVTDAQLGLVTTDDVNGFRALGPILGEAPADVDPFGVPIAA